jgi:hypothetical protein
MQQQKFPDGKTNFSSVMGTLENTADVDGKTENVLSLTRGRVLAGEIPACDSTKKRFFIFRNSTRPIFNRPIETKLPVKNYRSSLSST